MRLSFRFLSGAALLLSLSACGPDYQDTPGLKAAYDKLAARPADTLIVRRSDCERCLTARVLQGGTDTGRIAIAGKMPLDLLDKDNFRYDPDLAFRLVGKFIGTDSIDGTAKPLFYVTSFTRFSFQPAYWSEKSETGIYTHRNRMVQGIADNFLFEGHSLRELTAMLGQPDSSMQGKISYRVDDNRGGEVDRTKSSTLDISFSADSIITGKEIIDPLTPVK